MVQLCFKFHWIIWNILEITGEKDVKKVIIR